MGGERLPAERGHGWRRPQAVSHLATGLVHPLLILFAALLVPCLFVIDARTHGVWWLLNPITIILLGATTMAFYVTGQYFRRRKWIERLVWLVAAPIVIAFGLAMSVTCGLAVIEGMVASGGEFIRTPKGGRGPAGVDGLFARLHSRTLYTAVLCGELALGACMLAGAAYFQRGHASHHLGAAYQGSWFSWRGSGVHARSAAAHRRCADLSKNLREWLRRVAAHTHCPASLPYETHPFSFHHFCPLPVADGSGPTRDR